MTTHQKNPGSQNPPTTPTGTSDSIIKALLAKSATALQQSKNEQAEQWMLEAHKLSPNNPKILSNLGVLNKKKGAYKQALDFYKKALAINPQDAPTLSNIGSLLLSTRDLQAAIKVLNQSVKIDSKSSHAWNNLGSCYLKLGQYDKAQNFYQRSLQENAENHEARFNLSWCLLRLAEFQRGFQLYESRFYKGSETIHIKNTHSPLWKLESLANQPQAKLSFISEQGLGDTIQFVRFIRLLTQANLIAEKQIILRVQPPCVSILAHNFPNYQILSMEQPEPKDSAYHLPLMSLPLALKITPFDLLPRPYLSPDPNKIKQWNKNLNTGSSTQNLTPKKTVGIVWRGSQTNSNDYNRSMDLEKFMSIFQDCTVELIPIVVEPEYKQQLLAWGEKAPQNIFLKLFNQPISDCSDTAAIIHHCDLIVCVDSLVGHLAAALGKPVLMLVPYVHDWRWFRTITHSPWYPTLRLFRQRTYQQWDAPIEELNRSLKKNLTTT